MKKLALLMMIGFASQSYSQVNCSDNVLPTRKVLPQAVYLWQVSFGILMAPTMQIKFPHTAINPKTNRFPTFSGNMLMSLYKKKPNSDTTTIDSLRIVNFRYYLEDKNNVKIGLSIPEDPNHLLIHEGGANRIVNIESDTSFDYCKKAKDWKTFCESSNFYIYVKEYRYNWSNIFDSLGVLENLNSFSLLVEQVAHTVSPNDTNMYEVPQKGTTEGYFVLDLLFARMKTKGKDISKTILDFAMPCPKNCPPNRCHTICSGEGLIEQE